MPAINPLHEFNELRVNILIVLVKNVLEFSQDTDDGVAVDLCDGSACLSSTAGTPDPVQLVIHVLRHVVVDDEVHVGQVEPTCGHVGGDQDARVALDKLVDDLLTDVLSLVRVQHPCVDVVGSKKVLQVVTCYFLVTK